MTVSTSPVVIDVPFTVPFVHRLRFTADVLGDDRDVLLDLLGPSGPQPARVQFWLDGHVARARPDLAPRLEALARSRPGRLRQAALPLPPVSISPPIMRRAWQAY